MTFQRLCDEGLVAPGRHPGGLRLHQLVRSAPAKDCPGLGADIVIVIVFSWCSFHG